VGPVLRCLESAGRVRYVEWHSGALQGELSAVHSADPRYGSDPWACANRVRGQHREPVGPVLRCLESAGRVRYVEWHSGALQGELSAVHSADPHSSDQHWLHRHAGSALVWVYLRPVGAGGPLRRVADDSGGLPWELRRVQQGHLRVHVCGLAEVGTLPQVEHAEGRVPPPLRAVPLELAGVMTNSVSCLQCTPRSLAPRPALLAALTCRGRPIGKPVVSVRRSAHSDSACMARQWPNVPFIEMCLAALGIEE